jgi:hypothetical protein
MICLLVSSPLLLLYYSHHFVLWKHVRRHCDAQLKHRQVCCDLLTSFPVRASCLWARRVLLIIIINDAVSNWRLYIRRRWECQGMIDLKACGLIWGICVERNLSGLWLRTISTVCYVSASESVCSDVLTVLQERTDLDWNASWVWNWPSGFMAGWRCLQRWRRFYKQRKCIAF